jgi:hypothetical protein
MENVVGGDAIDPALDSKEAVRLSRLAFSLDNSDPDTFPDDWLGARQLPPLL